jgi:YtkA-like
MKFNWVKNAAAAALISYAWTVAAPARADITDYEFQLLQTDVKKADSAEIAVRLTDKRSGKTIPGAVIFAQRIDMAPDSMQEMTSSIAEMPSTEPGVYRFKVNLTMAGGWRLSLGAKV